MLRYGLAALLLGGAAFVAGDTSMSAADAPADVYQRRPPDPPEELPDLPSTRTDCDRCRS